MQLLVHTHSCTQYLYIYVYMFILDYINIHYSGFPHLMDMLFDVNKLYQKAHDNTRTAAMKKF